ncbi:unnamed protein product [Dibothriocephalus latus]|uniref:Uncharacterized protein n=1 Tax=Dibothriocephalus latus TaxID=60516 RepID=A0A3P7P1Y4_DIBLA|nr:unnamed protein product [Dibothriocephalus latus]
MPGHETERRTATARNGWSLFLNLVQLWTKRLRRRFREITPDANGRARSGGEKDAKSQVAANSTGPSQVFKFNEAEILARGDNHMSRDLLE